MFVIAVSFAALPFRMTGQQPFLVDDAGITERHHLELSLLNEYDALQTALFPNQNQNTARAMITFGLTKRIEIGVDGPLILISRHPSAVLGNAFGFGDLNFQFKCKLIEEAPNSRRPAFSIGVYTEIPTGNEEKELGSGKTDVWLNTILHKSLTDRTVLHTNAGIVFFGNTLTGTIGIRNPTGQVYSLGFSVTHEVTERLLLGGEFVAAIAPRLPLNQGQLQAQVGGKFQATKAWSLDFAITGGRYEAAPRLGAALGMSIGF
jgi:hypothetical protein